LAVLFPYFDPSFCKKQLDNRIISLEWIIFTVWFTFSSTSQFQIVSIIVPGRWDKLERTKTEGQEASDQESIAVIVDSPGLVFRRELEFVLVPELAFFARLVVPFVALRPNGLVRELSEVESSCEGV
jgi:hypothetical protein